VPVAELSYSLREEQILQLIAAGQTDKQIARELGISRKTVGTHLARLYVRGGFHSRTEAVVCWMHRPQA
jgi:DNA-binding CsgD family transcriptional regulator